MKIKLLVEISIICVFCLLSPLALLFGAKIEYWMIIAESIGLLLLIGFGVAGYFIGNKK